MHIVAVISRSLLFYCWVGFLIYFNYSLTAGHLVVSGFDCCEQSCYKCSCVHLCKYVFSFLWDNGPEVRLLGCVIVGCLVL